MVDSGFTNSLFRAKKWNKLRMLANGTRKLDLKFNTMEFTKYEPSSKLNILGGTIY